jgi:hypothetical protein
MASNHRINLGANTMNLKSEIKRLHPDFNGGDTSKTVEFTKLMADRKQQALENKVCLCGCGRKIYTSARWRGNQNLYFFSMGCRIFYKFYRNRLPAVAAATLLMLSLLVASGQTNSSKAPLPIGFPGTNPPTVFTNQIVSTNHPIKHINQQTQIPPFTNGQIHLTWNYNSNALAQGDASGTPFSFIMRGTNQMTPQPWPTLNNQIWTNYPIVGYDGSNYVFYMAYQIQPEGEFYFEATASNVMWGESGFSNTSSTPSVAIPINTQIAPN